MKIHLGSLPNEVKDPPVRLNHMSGGLAAQSVNQAVLSDFYCCEHQQVVAKK